MLDGGSGFFRTRERSRWSKHYFRLGADRFSLHADFGWGHGICHKRHHGSEAICKHKMRAAEPSIFYIDEALSIRLDAANTCGI
jgi:hypothetical protein